MSGRTTVEVEGLGTLPAVCTPEEFGEVTGICKRQVQAMCKRGEIPASQARSGGRWRIPTLLALRRMGLA